MHDFEAATALDNILAKVGLAVWQSQIVERAVAYHLVIVYGETDEAAEAKAAEAFANVEKKTLGSLLTALKKSGSSNSDLLVRLDAYREERNWVVHHSRHDYPNAPYNRKARAELLERLDKMANEAVPLANEVVDATDDFLVASGLRTREQLVANAKRLRASWHH